MVNQMTILNILGASGAPMSVEQISNAISLEGLYYDRFILKNGVRKKLKILVYQGYVRKFNTQPQTFEIIRSNEYEMQNV